MSKVYTEPFINDININKLYISVTSIFQRQKTLFETLLSIRYQQILPEFTKVYVYLSEEPYLLDKGFENKIITYKPLRIELENPFYVVKWVENEGPYRKLLPILKEKWNENCAIITIDDDEIYEPGVISHLFQEFIKRNCAIANRGFYPIENDEFVYWPSNYPKSINTQHVFNYSTGNKGVIYSPSFFKNTNDLIFRKDLYLNKDLYTKDDVWFNLVRMKNNIPLFLTDIISELHNENEVENTLFYYNGSDNEIIIRKYFRAFNF